MRHSRTAGPARSARRLVASSSGRDRARASGDDRRVLRERRDSRASRWWRGGVRVSSRSRRRDALRASGSVLFLAQAKLRSFCLRRSDGEGYMQMSRRSIRSGCPSSRRATYRHVNKSGNERPPDAAVVFFAGEGRRAARTAVAMPWLKKITRDERTRRRVGAQKLLAHSPAPERVRGRDGRHTVERSAGHEGLVRPRAACDVRALRGGDASRLERSRRAAEKRAKDRLREVAELPRAFQSLFSSFTYFNGIQGEMIDYIMATSRSFVVSACARRLAPPRVAPGVVSASPSIFLSHSCVSPLRPGAPSGSGKTVLFELAIIQMLLKRVDHNTGAFEHRPGEHKAIYMAPLKALVQEKKRNGSPGSVPSASCARSSQATPTSPPGRAHQRRYHPHNSPRNSTASPARTKTAAAWPSSATSRS